MKTVIIVQARMTSTRLPGKVLLQVLGRPLLDYQIERLRRVHGADEVLIATTTNATDEPIVEFCRRHMLQCYRGSEQDVLSRYYEAAAAAKADVVVRVTSDCPLIDPAIIDRVIERYAASDGATDYVSNTMERSFPRGLDCEVFSFRALAIAHHEAMEPPEREHVTPYLYHHPEKFRLLSVTNPVDLSRHRWTVDTPEDYDLIRRMLVHLSGWKPRFTMQDCLDLLEEHPEWQDINRHVEQKAYGK